MKKQLDKILAKFERLKQSVNICVSTIISSEIAPNLDAEVDTQLYQAQLTEDEDVQTIECLHVPGMQYNAPVGSRGFYSKIAEYWKIFVGIDDNVPKQALNPGELLIYSSSAGAVLTKIYLKNDANIEIITSGGAADVIVDNISVKNHWHYDSWGVPTSVPQPIGTTPVAPPATVIVASDVDMNTNSKTIDGVDVDQHDHDYTWTDPGGSGTTDPPN